MEGEPQMGQRKVNYLVKYGKEKNLEKKRKSACKWDKGVLEKQGVAFFPAGTPVPAS